MKTPFHYVYGLDRNEYERLKGELENGRDLYCWGGQTVMKRRLGALLYFRELAPKAEKLVEIISSLDSRRMGTLPQEAAELVMSVATKFETRWLFMMQDRDPSSIRQRKPLSECCRNYSRWSPNKANYAKLMDDFACDYIRLVYPDDVALAAKCACNRARWAKRRMPGSKKFKPGPKPKGGNRC